MFGVSNVGIIPKKATISSYRYWRVVWLQSRTTDTFFAAAAEIAFSNSSGGAQIAFSSSFASSADPATPVSNAFDGSQFSVWTSASAAALPQSAGVLFAASTSITYLKIQAGDTTARANRAPRLFRVEGSEDGSSYVTVYTSSDQAAWTALEIRNYYIGA